MNHTLNLYTALLTQDADINSNHTCISIYLSHYTAKIRIYACSINTRLIIHPEIFFVQSKASSKRFYRILQPVRLKTFLIYKKSLKSFEELPLNSAHKGFKLLTNAVNIYCPYLNQ